MLVAIGWRSISAAALMLGLLLLYTVTPAHAANFAVNSEDDFPDANPAGACDVNFVGAGQCSLRAAVRAANASSAVPHTITLPAGTYTLTRVGVDTDAENGDLDVTRAITINGAGAATTTVQAATSSTNTPIDRIFKVAAVGNLTLKDVTLRFGKPAEGDTGGAIRNSGTLELDGVVVAVSTAIAGGGIDARNPTTIKNSTIHTNTASTGSGGGGVSVSAATATTTLTNVTLSGNFAPSGDGAGIVISANADVTLNNVTVTGNVAQAGGGIRRVAGTVLLRNTIVSGNTPTNCAGTVTSEGFNLVFPGTGCGTSAALNDQINVDPILGSLLPNGTSTLTHAPGAGSGAIDRGNPAAPLDGTSGRCALKDQRGVVRPVDGDLNTSAICDIGAHEVSVFRVALNTDVVDLVPGDGFCDGSGTIGFQCHLRAAIQEANAIGGLHTIKLPANTYTLTRVGVDNTAENGDLDILADITILGDGAASTFVQAHTSSASSAVDRVFDVRPGGRLTLAGATVRHGKPADGGSGGAIRNEGILDLAQVAVTSNTAVTGGGVSAQGPTTITNSTIELNTATTAVSGGGGLVVSTATATTNLTNVTLSANTASAGEGGGLLVNGPATVTLNNVTVTGNGAQANGGIRRAAGTLTLRNTIVASNTPGNCGGTIVSGGFNLVFPGSGCGLSAGQNDQVNVDPKLQLLADNGGQTRTHALGAGSGAVDRGNPATPHDGTNGRCAATDQRGIARADGDLDGAVRCDIGAFELPRPPDLALSLTHTGAFAAGQNGVYTVTASNAAAATATSETIVVNVILPTGLTFVSGTGTGWSCGSGPGLPVVCTTNTSLAPGASSAITLTVAATPSAVPSVTTTATVSVASEFNASNNNASDPTAVNGVCAPRPNVSLQVSQTGPGTGNGRLRATLTVNTSSFNPSNSITKIKILKVVNAVVDELGGQNNLSIGEVNFANVASTSFIVRRLSSATPPRLPFHVEIEVTDTCNAWKTIVGGGPNVP